MASNKVVSLTKKGDSGDFLRRIKAGEGMEILVGIPAGSPRNRSSLIRARANKFFSSRKASKKMKGYLLRLAKMNTASNAQLLFWFSKGSSLRKQPPRPVIEPALQAPWNRREIAALVAQAVALRAHGQNYKAKQKLHSAGARAAKAARDWFKDPRNGWAENAYRTEQRKGRNTPGLDTGIMRAAITHIEKYTPEEPKENEDLNPSPSFGKEVSSSAEVGEKSISETTYGATSPLEETVKSIADEATEAGEGLAEGLGAL